MISIEFKIINKKLIINLLKKDFMFVSGYQIRFNEMI